MKVVSAEPVVCWPWHLRQAEIDPDEAHPIGAACCDCKRDVALRRQLAGRRAVCLYCAMGRGVVPEVEVEPW